MLVMKIPAMVLLLLLTVALAGCRSLRSVQSGFRLVAKFLVTRF